MSTEPPSTGRPKPMVFWRLAGLLVLVAGVATAGVVIRQLTKEVQNFRAAKASTEEYGRILDGHRQEMQTKYGELTTQYQQTVADRDNLLVQVKRLASETEQAQAEHELLDQDLRRIEGERVVFERELLALQQAHADLQAQQETVEQERRHLEGELAKLKERSAEKRLKTALEDSQHQYKELMAQRREAQREAARLKGQQKRLETEVAQLKGRLTPLEEKYAKLLLDHRTLKKQSAKIPSDVTEIAREHQRLLKDLADTHYNMGVNFAKRKDYPRAAIEFRKTIELRPDDADAHYNLGVIYAEHVPDRERALTFFRKYLTIKPRGTSANWAKQYIATWQAWEGKERLE